MGKKGSWFSAIKRVFAHDSKEKPSHGSDKKSSKEKKKGKGILGMEKPNHSFLSSESQVVSKKILGEAEELLIRPPTPSEQLKTPPALPWRPNSPRVASPKAAPHIASSPKAASPRVSSARITSPRATSPRVPQSRKEISYAQRPELTLRNQHLSALKIQAAYRGYLARRNFRALRGLVRLQGVVRGQNVKRQTVNAMKQMQLLVRVQTQIQSRRIQMLENQAFQHQTYRNDKEVESTLSKWTLNQLTEAGLNEDWDDSVLTKEEIEARLRRKVEAIIKRERAMAYAYSHQVKTDFSLFASLTSKFPGTSCGKLIQNQHKVRSTFDPKDFPGGGTGLERQLPPESTTQSQAAKKNVMLTPPRPVSDYKPSPQLNPTNYKHSNFTFNNQEATTPGSSVPIRAKQFQMTPSRTPPPAHNGSGFMKYTKPRGSGANSTYDLPLRDDDSLTSCPPFSVPNYMSPTVSAKAKARANSNPKERVPGTPGNDSKRRFSFALTPNIGPFKWSKGFNKDSASQKVLEKHKSSHSIGDLSVDSTVSIRYRWEKAFNRLCDFFYIVACSSYVFSVC
ncbi:UNVERIFIED_CONTAM: protein IQ-DOMAIN 14 [Sesamum angustifolium]|uniref:Protein IQ-DOMAIN 14 n=1 Tax=Sesamum angustifolium TaxID=2727405 RepID=A0AAW2J6T7_9LAMI